MPYPYANKLLVWPHSCEKAVITSRLLLDTAADENLLCAGDCGQGAGTAWGE